MNRYLLLILLSSWSHVVPLSMQCETGFARTSHVLDVPESLRSNADVALIKTYTAEDRNACMNECCTEKFGSCSVASFKKNVSDNNCQHFNCLPVTKCKYSSSNTTDSFFFLASSSSQHNVPSSTKNSSLATTSTLTTKIPKIEETTPNKLEHGVTNEGMDTSTVEQYALKNDNTSIKPRKGVEGTSMDFSGSVTRSGIKPRKGVTLDDGVTSNNTKSKVKPRKGVGPYHSYSSSFSHTYEEPSVHSVTPVTNSEHSGTSSLSMKSYKDIISNDLVSVLEKVFEDDTRVKDVKPTTSSIVESIISDTVISSTPTNIQSVIQTSFPSYTTSSLEQTSSSVLQSSLSTNYIASSSVQTPDLQTTLIQSTEVVTHTQMPSSSSPRILEHSKLLFHEVSVERVAESDSSSDPESETESENERKYKSSMHLVLSLIFGLLVLFSVLGVIAKRVYDGWMRRHYRRMDFLIDGMYNGYG